MLWIRVHMFWASGSVIILYGSGSFHQQAKKVRKPWFLLFCDILLYMKIYVNIPSNSNNQKNVRKKIIFCWDLCQLLTKKRRIRISKAVVGIRNLDKKNVTDPQYCLGEYVSSITLLARQKFVTGQYRIVQSPIYDSLYLMKCTYCPDDWRIFYGWANSFSLI